MEKRMIIDNEALMYFHSELNKVFFDGKLETAIVCHVPDVQGNDEGIEATTEETLEPFIIWFRRDVSEDEPVYVLTVLLHEMVHQYCTENGIEDMDGWEHSDEFRYEAEEHGLQTSGYELTEEAEGKVDSIIQKYNIIRDLKEEMVEDEVRKAKEDGYYSEAN